MAEAAKNAETAERLRGEIAELKAQGESDRIDFKLQLAGVRNVKAARVLHADHGNGVDKLKEAELDRMEHIFPSSSLPPPRSHMARTLPDIGTTKLSSRRLRW